ncbi:MAG: C39 family peptidase, partial [Candidatus Yanofskybacteria bacterium]|nr:C39 family peptidase [Candidatus Yanofskybacteria bacterium]
GKDVREKQIIKGIGGIKKYGVRTIRLAEFAGKSGFKTECLSYNRKLASGEAKIKQPSKKDILKFLKKGIPVIIAVRSFLLYGEKQSEMGHFIVVTGHKSGVFSYNDPHDGKRHKIAEEGLLFAWFNNVIDSSAYLLAVWPVKNKKSA